jgi:Zn-dependent protease
MLTILILIVVILLSLTLHEAMHAYVANQLGDDTARLSGRMTLNPLPHIDPFMTILLPILSFLSLGIIFGGAKPVPINNNRLKYNEFGSAIVAIAGPLTNLFLAIISGIWLRSSVVSDAWFAEILQLFCLSNIGLFAFNMIPFPPLDGSRLLYAFAPDFVRDVMSTIERNSLLFLILFVVLLRSFFGGFFVNIITSIFKIITGTNIF